MPTAQLPAMAKIQGSLKISTSSYVDGFCSNFSQTFSHPPTTYPENFIPNGPAIWEEFTDEEQDLPPLYNPIPKAPLARF